MWKEYTLKEVRAPQGYVLNGEQIEFYFEENNEGELEAHITNEDELLSIGDITIDGTNVEIIYSVNDLQLKDSPHVIRCHYYTFSE